MCARGLPFFGPNEARYLGQRKVLSEVTMDFSTITFDQLAMSVMTVIAIREAMIVVLPDRIAGPNGWLIDTSIGERA
jgi:hypothetical protein